jgi:membrane protein involved in colicin uptake
MEYQMPKNPTRIEINCTTGVESIIELTDAEVAELAVQAEAAAAKKAEEDAKAEADAVAKAALLDRLGITADEAKLLLS